MQFHKFLVGTLFVLATSSVHAQSVVNGNFNTDLSGWTHNPDTQWFGDDGPDGHIGIAFLGNNDPNAIGFISQTLTGLSAGATYAVGGYYESYGGFAGSHSLTAEVDGVTEFSNSDTQYILNWEPFNFAFKATGNTADLQINSQVGSDTNYLVDDISIVVVTPEPGSLSLVAGFGFSGGMFALRRRRNRSGE